MKCLAPLLFLVFLTSHAHAQEILDRKSYGNCRILTSATTMDMICLNISTKSGISISYEFAEGTLVTYLHTGQPQPHIDIKAPVALQIDTRERIRPRALVLPEYALLPSHALALRLLPQLAQGQRVTIRVGDTRATIMLNGSAQAIADFRQRANLSD